MCKVDGEPATFPPTCWTGSSPFWELFVARSGGTWSWSSLGVSALVLHDGDAEGLRYEAQSSSSPPAVLGNCPSPTPTPRPTARPSVTPQALPTPVPTPRPTAAQDPTLKPGSTPGPSLASVAPAASPPDAGSGMPNATGSGAPGDALAGVGGSPPATVLPGAAGATSPPAGSAGDGSPALPIAVLAIAGLAGLATIRRRPARNRGPR